MKNPEINKYGDKFWYNEKGQFHRKDDLPAIKYIGGEIDWWINNKRHRKDGPAVIWPDGAQFWWLNGHRHREDGPAVIFSDGRKEWYLNNQKYSEEEYNIYLDRNIKLVFIMLRV